MESIVVSRVDLRPLIRAGVAVATGLAMILSIYLLARRFSGAFVTPLSGIEFLVVMSAAGAGFSAVRWAWFRSCSHTPSATWLGLLLPLGCLVILVAALAMPETPWWGKAASLLSIAGIEIIWWRRHLPRHLAAEATPRSGVMPAQTIFAGDDAFEEEPNLPPDVTQQLTRSFAAGQGDSIYGLLRASIAPGERSHQLHVAFCPPFAERPQLSAFVVDGLDASVKIAQLESFGVRLEVVLPRHAQDPEEVLVEFEARCSLDSSERDSSEAADAIAE